MGIVNFVKKKEGMARCITLYGERCIGIAIMFAEIAAKCGRKVCVIDRTEHSKIYNCFQSNLSNKQNVTFHKVTYSLQYDNSIVDKNPDIVVFCNEYNYDARYTPISDKIYVVLDFDVTCTRECAFIVEKIGDKEFNLVFKDELNEPYRRDSIMAAFGFGIGKNICEIFKLPLCIEDRRCELDIQQYGSTQFRKLSVEYQKLLRDMCNGVHIDDISVMKVLRG